MTPLKAVLVMIALGLVRVLRPIVTIRFGNLFVSRLGHLAGNTECYLCEKDSGINRPKRVIDIWCPQGKPANEQLLKMFSRVVRISDFGGLVASVGSRFEWFKTHHVFNDSQWGRDIHNLMEKYPPHLKFTKADIARGERGLRLLGLPPSAKWVCIAARDSMFLKMSEPWQDYSYHDFRNSSIQNYREAAMALMDRGYYVLRMGQFVEEPMQLQAPQFIDYARHPLRCDFMDVYLGAKCAFTISNGLGFDGIPMIFRRPICFVNETPFEYLSTWMKDSLAIWKHHVKDGKRMTPAEIVASGAGLFHTSQQYRDAGITLVENTAAEILDVALEMLTLPTEAQPFWDSYPRSNSPHNGLPLHGEIKLRISSKFLASYAN
jgi:putative glycosyltransferase (TIGR04372 family)